MLSFPDAITTGKKAQSLGLTESLFHSPLPQLGQADTFQRNLFKTKRTHTGNDGESTEGRKPFKEVTQVLRLSTRAEKSFFHDHLCEAGRAVWMPVQQVPAPTCRLPPGFPGQSEQATCYARLFSLFLVHMPGVLPFSSGFIGFAGQGDCHL